MPMQREADRSCRILRWLLAGAVSTLALSLPALAAEAKVPGLEVSGLEVRVLDLDQAIDFFKLYGFQADERKSPTVATVRNGTAVIDLVKVSRKLDIDDKKVSNTHLNLRVEDLNAATAELKARDGFQIVGEPRYKSPVGDYAIIKDPSGNNFHLMEPSQKPAEGIKRGVFNVGITLTDMVKAREFYRDKLGFEIFSEDYFPPDLPLKRKGALPLVLHQTADSPAPPGYPETAETLVVLRAPDLEKAVAALKDQGVRFLHDQPQQSPLGTYVAFVDPFGIVFELREAAGQASR